MNFLRRRFSEGAPGANLPNGYLGNLSGPGSESAPSSPPPIQRNESTENQGLTNMSQRQDKAKCKLLLVIDDPHTDWSKYFKGRRILGDFEIRVEQAEFSEINVASYTEGGTMVDMQLYRQGTKIVRSFRPDFVLVRQHPKGSSPNEDYRNIILGFQYGQVPSINSWPAIYNFMDKPWVFSHLLKIQKKLGKEKFPLVEQAFYPNHKEMVSTLITPRFPIIVKIGHAHGGLGKVKVNGHTEFQDIASIIGITNNYCTTEPYIDSKYDIRVQKIGNNYKAYMRTSISSSWKANTGSAMLEQIAMNDTFKHWVDAVSDLFGGMEICAVSAIKGKDNKDYIIEANDCTMPLLGEKQDEERRQISDLVVTRMQKVCGPQQSISRSLSGFLGSPFSMTSVNPMQAQQQSAPPVMRQMETPPPRPANPQPPPSQNSSKTSSASSSPQMERKAPPTDHTDAPTPAPTKSDDAEISFQNLKRAFSGIFGDNL